MLGNLVSGVVSNLVTGLCYGDRADAYDFTTGTLPSGFTYTRNDTKATYRDSSGNLTAASANTPRFDHDINGNFLGMMIEPAITNRLTDRNANPTTTSGWTTTGDVAGVFSVVNDPSSYLSASTCKLQNVCTTGKLFKIDNSLGVTDFSVVSVAGISVTSRSTLSCWIVVSTGSATLTRNGGGTPETLAISSGAALQRKALIVTPAATTNNMVITVAAGGVAYFILGQIEPAYARVVSESDLTPVPSSEIITTGGAAARVAEIVSLGYTDTQGSVVMDLIVAGYDLTSNQYAFAFVGNSNSDYSGARLGVATAGSGNGFFASNTVKNTSSGNGVTQWNSPPIGRRYPIGFAYKVGETTMMAGSMRPQITTITNQPVAPTALYLGTRSLTGSEAIKCWVRHVYVFGNYASPQQMGLYMFSDNDFGISLGGQSNAQYWSLDQEPTVYNNSGEEAAISTMDTYWTSTDNWIVQGATGGTGLLIQNGAVPNVSGYWVNPDTGEWGDAYYSWEKSVKCFMSGGGVIGAIVWDQGENDSLDVATSGFGAGNNATEYRTWLLSLFVHMRSIVGEVPVIISPIGRRQTSYVTHNGYEVLRELQYDIAADYNWIHIAPEKFIQPLDARAGNNVHLSKSGYAAHAPIVIKKVRDVLEDDVVGAVDGVVIESASRSGATVTIVCAENITPAASAEGLTFFDGSSKILFTSVTTSGATITGTLASTPSGGNTETLYFGYNDLPDVSDYTKIIVSASSGLAVRGGTAMVLPFTSDLVTFEGEIVTADGYYVTV